MAHVRFTRNFYADGEVKFAAGSVHDVEHAALHIARGEAELVPAGGVEAAVEPAPATEETGKAKRRR